MENLYMFRACDNWNSFLTISDLEKVTQKKDGTFCSKHLDYNNVQVFKLFKIILFVTRSILFYDNRKPYANIIPKSSLQAKLEF